MKKLISILSVFVILGLLSVSCRGKKETCPAYGKVSNGKTKHI